MKKIELFYEPLAAKEINEIKCEMTDSQLAFLCGILKYKKPKKVVEVGVAHGGTTCIIIECLKELGNSVEIHSVDISEECYRASGKRTGYLVDSAFDRMPNNISHKWHLGRTLPQQLESIGKNIDVIILDTAHIMPGEMLDFLAAFPYLSKDAVIVLHDVLLNQLSNNEFAYATRIVYDVVVAEKIIADGVDSDHVLPNIGAFEITEDTEKYIEKCFSSLTVTWKYDLSNQMIRQYKDIYNRFYDTELIELFDKAVTINRNRLQKEKSRIQEEKETIVNFHKCIADKCKLVLFGGGDFAERISCYLREIGREADAYVISDNMDLKECRIKKNIYHFSELPFLQSECNLVMAIAKNKQKVVFNYLKNSDFHSIYPGVYDDYTKLINYIDEYIYLKRNGF